MFKALFTMFAILGTLLCPGKPGPAEGGVLGSKFEFNDYTGIEIQPNIRMIWTPRPEHAVWSAVSRAVRLPTRAKVDGRYIDRVIPLGSSPESPITVFQLTGNPDFRSEEALTYELGYRIQIPRRLSLDIAGYYSTYDQLRSGRSLDPVFDPAARPPRVIFTLQAENKLNGTTAGIESSLEYLIREEWRLKAAYTYLHTPLDLDPGSLDTAALAASGDNPKHQAHVHASLDLNGGILIDLIGRGVSSLPNSRAKHYITTDIRLGLRLNESAQLAITDQNLLQNHHKEFDPELLDALPTEIQRGVYGTLAWDF